MTARALLAGCALIPLLLAGCGGGRCCSEDGHAAHAKPVASLVALRDAVAVLAPTQGNHAKAVVRFSEDAGKMKIVVDAEGLTPGKKHAFHIHEFGDIASTDGASAGGHYNPEGHDHAGLDTPHRHAGDLGNLLADAAGKAHLELSVDNLTVSGGRNPVIGRSVVIHAGEDDLKTQPTGNAGPRIAVGVIGVAKPAAK